MPTKISALRQQRAAAYDTFKALADKPVLSAEERTAYGAELTRVRDFDDQIERALAAQAMAASTAQPVAGQEQRSVPASVENSAYVSDAAAKRLAENGGVMPGSARSIVLGGTIKMLAAGNGSVLLARQAALETYGENHPVLRALNTSIAAAGGLLLQPDQMNEVIEMLRAVAVVRSSGPRVIPMPRGTMTLPGQASAATANYAGEGTAASSSQQSLNAIVASFRKMTALVPVSNDMMRYADPAIDAFVRDDLVKVVGLREDLAFLLGVGSAASPRGFTSFANGWVAKNGGTAGLWLPTGNSTAAVNGTPSATDTSFNGGNFITSTEAYNLVTVTAEIGGAVNKMDTANVPDNRRVWFMHPRTYNYLYDALNSLGVYVWRDELEKGKLRGYPVKKTTQIPVNYWDPTGTNKDCSVVILAEMTEAMIFDAMSMELAVSRDATYQDASGNTVSTFTQDQTLIRAITEHDFQLRHDAAVAVIQFVRWAPANA